MQSNRDAGRKATGEACESCGINTATTSRFIGWWSYGIRSVKNVKLCKRCAKASDNGEL